MRCVRKARRPRERARILVFALGAVFFTCFPWRIQAREELIPRRVYIGLEGNIPAGADSLVVKNLPDALYAAVSDRQPIVRVHRRGEAHSVILVSADPGEAGMSLEITLSRPDGTVLFTSSHLFDGDFSKYLAFIEKTASETAQLVPMVEPEVRIIEEVEDETVRRMVEEIDFADRMASRFTLTLWMSGYLRDFNDFTNPVHRFSVFPIILDAAWHYNRTGGITASLYFDSVDADFDGTADFFFFPGVGIYYRTLGRVSAGFGLQLFLGPVFRGTGTTLGSLLLFYPALVVNITPKIAVKTRFGFAVYPPMMVGLWPGTWEMNLLYTHFFAIGFSYRLGKTLQ